MKRIWAKSVIGVLGLFMVSCGPIDTHIYPVTITADPESIYTGESTKLTWSAPGGIQVLSSNFGTHDVSGYAYVSPSSTTEYKIKIRLASNDIYTAKVTVNVSDPPPPPEEDTGEAAKFGTKKKPK